MFSQITLFRVVIVPKLKSEIAGPQVKLKLLVYGALFLSKFNLLVVFTHDLRFSNSIFLSFDHNIRFSTSTVVLFNLDSRFLSSTFVLFKRNVRFIQA